MCRRLDDRVRVRDGARHADCRHQRQIRCVIHETGAVQGIDVQPLRQAPQGRHLVAACLDHVRHAQFTHARGDRGRAPTAKSRHRDAGGHQEFDPVAVPHVEHFEGFPPRREIQSPIREYTVDVQGDCIIEGRHHGAAHRAEASDRWHAESLPAGRSDPEHGLKTDREPRPAGHLALIRLLRVAGRDPAELLIYAWMPLPVWEFAGNAHIDGAAAGLLALALLIAVRGRSIWTGIVLAAATLTKFLPLVVLPAFFRPRDWRLPAAFVATLVVCYLPYISVGWPVLGFLPDYVSEEGFASGHGIFLLELLGKAMTLPGWAPRAYIVLVVGVLGCLAARFALTTELPAAPGPRALMQARQAVILGGVLLVALSPHYPWYLGWLAPLACLAPLPSVLWMLGAAPLLAHGSFEYLAVPGAVYLPAVILAAIDLCRRLPVPPQLLRSVQ